MKVESKTRQSVRALAESGEYSTLQQIAFKLGITKQAVHQHISLGGIEFLGQVIRKNRTYLRTHCVVCEAPIRNKSDLCIKHQKEKRRIRLICSNCGKDFTRLKSAYARGYKGKPREFAFCCSYCNGQYSGRYYGWGKNKKG